MRTLFAGPVPIALLSADGALWTATIDGPTLVRLDPATGKTQNFKLGSSNLEFGPAIADAAGSIWVAAPPNVVRFDPTTLKVLATIEAGPDVYDLAPVSDGVWFSVPQAGTISRIDAASNQIALSIQVPAGPKELLVDGSSIWVASHTDGAIRKVDMGAGNIAATVNGLDQPRNMALRSGLLWVADLDGRIFGVDPAAAAIQSSIEVHAEPFGILSTPDSIVVSGSSPVDGGELFQVDPNAAVVVGESLVGHEHLGEPLCDGGHLWVPDLEGNTIIELAAPVCA